MFKKIIIPSIVVVLTLVVGGGVWRFISSQGRQPLAISQEKEPIAKLVYVGTNETLSEALYHLDLLDGKLDEPHIVHRVIEPPHPLTALSKEKLIFIGKDGKIKKEIIFASKKSKIDINLLYDGKYAEVLYDYGQMGDIWSVDYYDINGNLIFRKQNTDDWYKLLPDGKTLIRYKRYMDQLLENKIYFVDLRERVLKEHTVDSEGNKFLGLKGEIVSSENGLYHLLNLYLGNWQKNRLLLFDNKGNLILSKKIDGYEISGRKVLNSGIIFLVCYAQGSATRQATDESGGKTPVTVIERYGQIIRIDNSGNERKAFEGYGLGMGFFPGEKKALLFESGEANIMTTDNLKISRVPNVTKSDGFFGYFDESTLILYKGAKRNTGEFYINIYLLNLKTGKKTWFYKLPEKFLLCFFGKVKNKLIFYDIEGASPVLEKIYVLET